MVGHRLRKVNRETAKSMILLGFERDCDNPPEEMIE